jgi:DNA-binding PadR family transcriptional regulator
MSRSPAPPDPGALRPVEFEILLSLAQGERHGYAILQDIEARSDGATRLETGTMYRALRRLVEAGLAAPSSRRPPEPDDDERRRYYAITASGRRAAAMEAARMARLVAAARTARLIPIGATP